MKSPRFVVNAFHITVIIKHFFVYLIDRFTYFHSRLDDLALMILFPFTVARFGALEKVDVV